MSLRPLAIATLATTALGSLSSAQVFACGLTPPIGPSGLPTVCRGDGPSTSFRAGVAVGGTSTEIDFGPTKAELLQAATVATLDYFPIERLGIGASLGASLGGRLDHAGQRYDLRPGPLAGLALSYRLLGGELPYFHLSVAYSIASGGARAPDDSSSTFTSRDYRLGLAVGKTIGRVAAPFVVARYFGAGTDWSVAGKGADENRYHVGAGGVLALSERVDLLVELAFLGERRATLGAGFLF
jgi:hypothetical protein